MRRLAALPAVLLLPGCVVGTVVETAVDVTATAVTTTADVAATVVTAPIRAVSGDDDDDGNDDAD